MTTSKVGYVLALFLLPLLAACSPAASEPAATAAEATTVAPPTATITPEPTATPTEIPDPEVTFEQLALMDASIGSFVQDEEGKLTYNSPLYNTEVGKSISVVQQYREVGLDGGGEVWIAPEKYPNAPIVIQDLDTGEIRQGPFKYDNDVRRRLTMPSSGMLYNYDPSKGLEGSQLPLTTIRMVRNSRGSDTFIATMVPTAAGLVERDDHLVLPVKSYVGDENDMLAFYYDLSLGPIGASNSYYNPWFNFYDNGRESIGSLNHILEPAYQEAYSRRFSLLGMQIAVAGFYDMASRESIPQNTYAGNFYYAEDNAAESRALLSILESGGIGELEDDLDYSSLSLYGAIDIVVR